MKTKGFTLVELLAVIVILAIIGVIAIPIILNVIEKSKVAKGGLGSAVGGSSGGGSINIFIRTINSNNIVSAAGGDITYCSQSGCSGNHRPAGGNGTVTYTQITN